MKDFSSFDFSLITNPDYWYFEAIVDPEIRKDFEEKIEAADHKREEGKKMML